MARLANTSPATVSYVLNDGPKHVSDETTQRVLKAIATLGYRPDPVARSFRGFDSQALGMLVPNFSSPFFSELIAEVERQAAARGKVMLFASTGLDPATEERMLQTFRDRRVDAVFVIAPTTDLRVPGIEHGALNVLRFGRTTTVTAVGIAQETATRAAVQHLVEHGRSDIAAIFGPNYGVFNVRYRGWRDAMKYTGEQTKRRVRRADYSLKGGFDSAKDLFAEGPIPDAVFTSTDAQAIGAIKALHKLGLRVPEDVAVVAIDATELSSFLVPSLTAIRQPTDLLAQEALNIVDIPPCDSPKRVRVPFTLDLHESCGCVTVQSGSAQDIASAP